MDPASSGGANLHSTDAVFQYLLVRYGLNPLDLRDMQNGAVIGDVL